MPNDLSSLGSTVQKTYQLLSSPSTAKELAVLRGVTPATIRRHLATLKQHGHVQAVIKPGAPHVWSRSDHDHDDDVRRAGRGAAPPSVQTRPALVAGLTHEPPRQLPIEAEPAPEPRPETALPPRSTPQPESRRNRNVALLGLVGVLVAAVVIAVGLQSRKGSSFDTTPAASNVTSPSPTFGSVAPSVPTTPAADLTHDIPLRGPVTIGGRAFTQEQARGYLTRIRQVLAANAFVTSDVDSDLLSIGAGICNDLDAGSGRDQEIDALRVVLEVESFEANLFYAVTVGRLCTKDSPDGGGADGSRGTS